MDQRRRLPQLRLGEPHLDGAALAAGGVVVVSAHYRTGVEGFARLAGAPDNRGLLDQIAALQWVQDNAAVFGSDPDSVTVFGQSAGAGAIAALLCTYFTTDLADDIAVEIAAELGRVARGAELTDIAPDDLVGAARTVTGRIPERVTRWGARAYTPTPFSPVVDGDALPTAPWVALAGGAARGIELLVGHTRDEFGLLAARLGDIDDAAADAMVDRLTPTPERDGTDWRTRVARGWTPTSPRCRTG